MASLTVQIEFFFFLSLKTILIKSDRVIKNILRSIWFHSCARKNRTHIWTHPSSALSTFHRHKPIEEADSTVLAPEGRAELFGRECTVWIGLFVSPFIVATGPAVRRKSNTKREPFCKNKKNEIKAEDIQVTPSKILKMESRVRPVIQHIHNSSHWDPRNMSKQQPASKNVNMKNKQ